jgi:hypothetical protein
VVHYIKFLDISTGPSSRLPFIRTVAIAGDDGDTPVVPTWQSPPTQALLSAWQCDWQDGAGGAVTNCVLHTTLREAG